MRLRDAAVVAALALAQIPLSLTAPSNAADIEKPSAIDGSAYAVIAPTYNNPNGSQSYIRLFNGASTDAVFTVNVVGSPSARTYGTATITVPSNASPQLGLSVILTLANAAALNGADTAYALYVKSVEPKAGYQHVTFNGATTLFGNASDCTSTLGEVMSQYKSRVLTNVHTSRLAAYPSTIYVHNYSTSATTYRLTVIDAGSADGTTGAIRSGSGSVIGYKDVLIGADTTYSTTFSGLETAVGWQPSSSQVHANLVVTNPAGSNPQVVVAQSILNQSLGGEIDMSVACAVNPVVATASSATTLAGTIAGTGGQSGTLTIAYGTAAASASAPAASAAIEKSQAAATTTASATLLLSDKSTVALTGSFASSTGAMSLTGGGFSLTGTVTSGVYKGSYTGPSATSGAVAALDASVVTITGYCGGWTSSDPMDNHGAFNILIGSDGSLSGSSSGGKGVTLGGSASSSSFSGMSSEGVAFSGSYGNGKISGTFTNGSFTGSECAFPPQPGDGGGSGGSGGSNGGGSGGSTGGGGTPSDPGLPALLSLSTANLGGGTGTITSSPAGISCSGMCTSTSASFSIGTSVVLTATPDAGSTFHGWGGACSGTGTCTLVMSSAQNVTAAFYGSDKSNGFLLTLAGTSASSTSPGQGSVTSNPSSIVCTNIPCNDTKGFAGGSTVTLTATPASGSTFQGWSGACSGTQTTCTVTMTAAQSVTATFAGSSSGSSGSGGGSSGGSSSSTYLLSVSATGSNGSVSASPALTPALIGTPGGSGQGSFAPGTVVTLTATAATGSHFAGWSGACSGTSPTCIVTMNAIQSVIASFATP